MLDDRRVPQKGIPALNRQILLLNVQVSREKTSLPLSRLRHSTQLRLCLPSTAPSPEAIHRVYQPCLPDCSQSTSEA